MSSLNTLVVIFNMVIKVVMDILILLRYFHVLGTIEGARHDSRSSDADVWVMGIQIVQTINLPN